MPRDEIDWKKVKRVLIVKLRSIGDTVLSTPSLIALRRFVPDAQIDILLEDWVAPLLDGCDSVDNVISVGSGIADRVKTAFYLRRRRYDVAINLHGGTTATFFTGASGVAHRVGYREYRYSFIYNHLLSSASDFWEAEFTHSAEQQLALLGFVGVPVSDRPKSRLAVTESSLISLERKFQERFHQEKDGNSVSFAEKAYALLHPASAFATKQWPTENFAQTAEFLAAKGIISVAVASKTESEILDRLKLESQVPILTFDDLSLPEITALASRASLFVGNDSGIAHIAAAVDTPSVVVFGSSNRNHWRPWTEAPNEMVFNELPCQPCAGYECKVFGEPKCILSVEPFEVFGAIERVLKKGRLAKPAS